jgi:hypothetical protein
MYLGNFIAGATVYVGFNTVDKTNGAPITLAGTPVAKVYKGNSTTTEVTTGLTLSVDNDSLTGHHVVTVDTSADGTFYAAGGDFRIVLTAGTVDGVSVVGTIIGSFSVENRNTKADVRQYGGTNGTFASGRPEVNFTHARGTVLPAPTVAGIPKVEVSSYSTNQDPGTSVRDMPSSPTSLNTLGGDIHAGFVAANSVDQKLTTARAGYLDSINTGLTLAGTQTFNNTGTWTGNHIGNMTGSAGSVASAVTVGTNNDKTGYTATVSDKTGFKLASDGLNAIDVTAPTTVAATFPAMVNQLWRRFFKKVTKTSTQIRTYADDGTTIVTTSTVADDSVTQTQGTAS